MLYSLFVSVIVTWTLAASMPDGAVRSTMRSSVLAYQRMYN